jgi:hypothetical protein
MMVIAKIMMVVVLDVKLNQSQSARTVAAYLERYYVEIILYTEKRHVMMEI